jgi:hypothetical protein
VRVARKKKEQKKKEELESREVIELSETAHNKKRKEIRDREERQKKVMRQQATQAKRVEAKQNKVKGTTRRQENNKDDQNIEEELEATPSEKTDADTKVNEKKKNEEKKGKRRVPEAEDEHGCKHSGLLGLIALPKNYLRTYVKEGGWLYKKPCKDCAAKESGNGDENLVLDVANLLGTKGRAEVVAYYCNCGPAGFRMNEDHAYKAAWTCDMVLCMTCYNARTNVMSGDTTAKRSRRRCSPLD